MPARPAWSGYLKLSLVTCAVELHNATTQADKVSFHILNRDTGNRVRRQYVDSVTGKPLRDEDEVKGYELGDDEFLLIEEEEIDALQIESTHTLNLETFVEKARIDPIYLDTPYYLVPADDVSEEAFAVIREALEEKKMAGLARIVLYRRERPAVVEPLGKGMLVTTLRYDDTVREPEGLFEPVEAVKPDKDMIELAAQIVEKKKKKFDPRRFEDRHEAALVDLIEAKKKGRKAPKAKPEEKPSNVVNLFDALKKSLAAGGPDSDGDGKRPAKATEKGESGRGKAHSARKPAKGDARKKRKSG